MRATSAEGRQARVQFGLRTLLSFVGGLCTVLALVQSVSWTAGLTLAWFACLIFFHMAGNALGTSLRDGATRQLGQAADLLPTSTKTVRPTPCTRLRNKTPLSIVIPCVIGLGATLGGAFGGLALSYWGRVAFSGLVVGALSSAVVGGFLGFLASSFLTVSAAAWHEATQEIR